MRICYQNVIQYYENVIYLRDEYQEQNIYSQMHYGIGVISDIIIANNMAI